MSSFHLHSLEQVPDKLNIMLIKHMLVLLIELDKQDWKSFVNDRKQAIFVLKWVFSL